MKRYWNKYPDEEEIDPTIKEIEEMANKDSYYLAEYVFIIYEEIEDEVKVIFYCLNAGDLTPKQLRKAFIEHKRFVRMFDKPVYMGNLKDVYIRDNMVQYCNNKNSWRLL